MFSIRYFLVSLLLVTAPLHAAINVSVGIDPLRYLVEQLGAERVVVSALLAGADPHALDPSPAQLLSLRKSDLYFGAGLPFERGLGERLAGKEKLLWLDQPADHESETAETAETAETGLHSEEQQHGSHAHDIDPHRWTSPTEMLRMGRAVSEALQRFDPAGELFYQDKLKNFELRITALRADIIQTLAAAPKTFVADHPAWGWFSREFGLQQLAVEQGGKQPSFRRMSQLLKDVRQSGARYVVSEHKGAQVEALASRLGLQLLVVNPLSHDWEAELRKISRGLAQP